MDEIAILKRAVERAGEELSGTHGFCPLSDAKDWPPEGKDYCREGGDLCAECCEDWLKAEAEKSLAVSEVVEKRYAAEVPDAQA